MGYCPPLGVASEHAGRGSCHFDLEGYAQFARFMRPLVEQDNYGLVPQQAVTAPNLKRAWAGVEPLEPFYDITGKGFSFPKMIQPILDAKCVRCHDGSESPDLRAAPIWDAEARKFWNQSYHVLISTDRPPGPANDTSQELGVIAEKSRYLNWIGHWSVPEMIPPYSFGSSRSPLVSLLKSGHAKVEMTQEEMDKISCWIDLALPHSGDWTEGMTSDDTKIYMNVYRKRLDWEKQEAANIQEYIEAQAPANRSGEPDPRQK